MVQLAEIRVVARPRIHIGLVDLSGASHRSYGGVGFAVNGKPTIWKVRHHNTSVMAGIEHLDADAKRDLASIEFHLAEMCRDGGYSAQLEEIADQHIGLGTKTTLCMALISAVSALKNFGLTRTDVVGYLRPRWRFRNWNQLVFRRWRSIGRRSSPISERRISTFERPKSSRPTTPVGTLAFSERLASSTNAPERTPCQWRISARVFSTKYPIAENRDVRDYVGNVPWCYSRIRYS